MSSPLSLFGSGSDSGSESGSGSLLPLPPLQVLSKTPAHDVLVPWQHEVVSEKEQAGSNGAEGTTAGANGEEVIDVEEGAEKAGRPPSFTCMFWLVCESIILI